MGRARAGGIFLIFTRSLCIFSFLTVSAVIFRLILSHITVCLQLLNRFLFMRALCLSRWNMSSCIYILRRENKKLRVITPLLSCRQLPTNMHLIPSESRYVVATKYRPWVIDAPAVCILLFLSTGQLQRLEAETGGMFTWSYAHNTQAQPLWQVVFGLLFFVNACVYVKLF